MWTHNMGGLFKEVNENNFSTFHFSVTATASICESFFTFCNRDEMVISFNNKTGKDS